MKKRIGASGHPLNPLNPLKLKNVGHAYGFSKLATRENSLTHPAEPANPPLFLRLRGQLLAL